MGRTDTTKESVDCVSPSHSAKESVDCVSPSHSAKESVDCVSPSHSAKESVDCVSPSHSAKESVDCVSPSHSVSNLRLIKFAKPTDETEIEKYYRIKRICVQEFNHNYWRNNNKDFQMVYKIH